MSTMKKKLLPFLYIGLLFLKTFRFTSTFSLTRINLKENLNKNDCRPSFKMPEIPKINDKIIVGYANWNQCDDSIIQSVLDGVNVIVWFSINLDSGPAISNGPNMDCVGKISNQIQTLGLEVVHLISIGGWNSPHPDTSSSAQETFGIALNLFLLFLSIYFYFYFYFF